MVASVHLLAGDTLSQEHALWAWGITLMFLACVRSHEQAIRHATGILSPSLVFTCNWWTISPDR